MAKHEKFDTPETLTDADVEAATGGGRHTVAVDDKLAAEKKRAAAAQFAPKPGIEGVDIGSGA